MERLTFDGNFCDIALCSEVRYGSFCEDGSCSQRRVWERLKSIEDILGGDYNLDRFRELVQADREGRCVVTELAPGDEVWVVERDEDGNPDDFSGYIFITSVRGIAIVSPSSQIGIVYTRANGIPSGDDGWRAEIKCKCGANMKFWALEKSWAKESITKAWNRRAGEENGRE